MGFCIPVRYVNFLMNSNLDELNGKKASIIGCSEGLFHAVYFRQENTLTIIFDWCGTADAAQGFGFWQLAESYRPKAKYEGSCIGATNNGAVNNIGLVIDTAGNIYHTSSTGRRRVSGIVSFEQ